jgi:hypothetical protein
MDNQFSSREICRMDCMDCNQKFSLCPHSDAECCQLV